MNANKFSPVVIFFLICFCTNVYPQYKTFTMDDILISYSKNSSNAKTVSSFQDYISLDKITRITFLSDSIINVSSEYYKTETDIPVRNISSLKISTGSKYWLGAGIGAGAGTILGVLSANLFYKEVSKENGSNIVANIFTEWTGGWAKIVFPVLGFFVGGLIGGGIGQESQSYKTYDLNYKMNERNKAERLFKILNENKIE